MKGKIEVVRGDKEALELRKEDLRKAEKEVCIVAGLGAATERIHPSILEEVREAVDRGVEVRFLRNLTSEREMKKAKSGKGKTRHFPFRGLNFVIVDEKEVRIETLTDEDERLNLLVNDKNLAQSYYFFFQSLWGESTPLKGIESFIQKIYEMLDGFVESVKEMGEVKSITHVGKWTEEGVDIERPHVRTMIFAEERNPELLLRIREIVCDLAEKYSEDFALRTAFSPSKYSLPFFPRKPGERMVMLTPLVAPLKPKGPLPFGRPVHITDSFKDEREVAYGKDILGSHEFELRKEGIFEGVEAETSRGMLSFSRAPMAYDLSQDWGELALEAMDVGRFFLEHYLAFLLTEEKFQKDKYKELIDNEEKFLQFLKGEEKDLLPHAETIFQAEKNQWILMKKKEKAYEVFRAAYAIQSRLMELIQREGER